MALIDDLRSEVTKIFKSAWTVRDGRQVPTPEQIGLGNDAVRLDATVMYADLHGSTELVDQSDPRLAAEIYKAYLHCAAKLIRKSGGSITSYDGDRIMGVFVGATPNTDAAKCALQINYAVREIVNPALHAQYPTRRYDVRQVVGIDASSILVARTGVRGDNDLVWIGRAANYAAKLSNEPPDYPTRITTAVYDRLASEAKYSNGQSMWTQLRWAAMPRVSIYGSTWTWKP